MDIIRTEQASNEIEGMYAHHQKDFEIVSPGTPSATVFKPQGATEKIKATIACFFTGPKNVGFCCI